MPQQAHTRRKLSGLLSFVLLLRLPTKAQCIGNFQKWAQTLNVLQYRLIIVRPHKQSACRPISGPFDDKNSTSGMPTPRLISWLG